MSNSAQEAYNDIVAYIKECGGAYSTWYAGITATPKQRLFTDHNVSEKDGSGGWIYRQCPTSEGARNVEKKLLEDGCDGGSGGGDNPTYVYAYQKVKGVTEP